jgi:hypothetical protein
MIFLESPWPILFVGIALEAILAIALARTGRGVLLWGMLGAAVLIVIGLVAERLVVTDQKSIRATLDEAAAAVAANNIDRLLKCISPSALAVRQRARLALRRIEVHEIRLSNLDIQINRLTALPTARVALRALGRGRDRLDRFPYDSFAEPLTVELRKENGRWLVTGYEAEYDPSL